MNDCQDFDFLSGIICCVYLSVGGHTEPNFKFRNCAIKISDTK